MNQRELIHASSSVTNPVPWVTLVFVCESKETKHIRTKGGNYFWKPYPVQHYLIHLSSFQELLSNSKTGIAGKAAPSICIDFFRYPLNPVDIYLHIPTPQNTHILKPLGKENIIIICKMAKVRDKLLMSSQWKSIKFHYTIPETNIASENWWLEDEISFWDGLFSGAMIVSGRANLDVFICSKVRQKTQRFVKFLHQLTFMFNKKYLLQGLLFFTTSSRTNSVWRMEPENDCF